MGEHPFGERGRGEHGEQLLIDQTVDDGGRRGHKAHTPAGREDFREPAEINGVLQLIEHAHARAAGLGERGIDIVFDHLKAVAPRELQHAVRAGRAEALPGGVVQHAHADEQARRMGAGQLIEEVEIGAIGPAGDGQQLEPVVRHLRELHRPAGALDQHRVAGAGEGAQHEIKRLRCAIGGQNLLRRHLQRQAGQLPRQGFAQGQIAQRMPVVQRSLLQFVRAGDAPQGRAQRRTLQPRRGQHAGTGRAAQRHRSARPHLMKHAAHQRGSVRRRQHGRSGIGLRGATPRQRGRVTGYPHEIPTLRARLHQPEGLQPVIRRDHGLRAQPVPLGAFAHRRQAAARGQQAVADAGGKLGAELLCQGGRRMALQRPRLGTQVHCIGDLIHTDAVLYSSSVLVVYRIEP